MIEYRELEAWYPGFRNRNEVLEKCSFNLKMGSITALSGLNGSGKTTLLKAILGISLFAGGELCIDEEKQDSIILSKILSTGYAPELLSSGLTATPNDLFSFNNVLHFENSLNNPLFNKQNITQTFDLEEYKDVSFKKLSKGTKKRVLVANAFLNNPRLLVLDEPFEGLDKDQRKRLKDLLIGIKKDRIILISSHESLELSTFCDEFLNVEHKEVKAISK